MSADKKRHQQDLEAILRAATHDMKFRDLQTVQLSYHRFDLQKNSEQKLIMTILEKFKSWRSF